MADQILSCQQVLNPDSSINSYQFQYLLAPAQTGTVQSGS